MSDNLLAQRAGQAFAALLAPVYRTIAELPDDADVPVYARDFTEIRTASMIECSGDTGEEFPQYTGNFFVNVTVSAQTPSAREPGRDDPKDIHLDLISAITNALHVDDLEAQLSAAVEDFHVFAGSMQRLGDDRPGTDGAMILRNTLSFRFLACASDLT